MTGQGPTPGYGDQWQPQHGGWQYGQPPQQQPPQQSGGDWYYGQQPQQPVQQGGYTAPYPQQGQWAYGSGGPQQPGMPPGAPQQPPRRGRRGIVITVVVAVVALLAGGGTWFAISRMGSSGADSPTAAAEMLVSTLEDEDLVGALETLPPGEAELLVDTVESDTSELARLGLFESGADADSLGGAVDVSTENLSFDEAEQQRVNDHLTIATLSEGKMTFSADPDDLPFSDELRDAVTSGGGIDETADTETETVDAAQLLRAGNPIRIATVKVDGDWYPSLAYTIADYTLRDAGESWPDESIPARGADSPEAAVKDMINASTEQNTERVIELLPPDVMGALHDAGPALLGVVDPTAPSDAELVDLDTKTSNVSGGTRVELVSAKVRGPAGMTMSIRRDDDCFEVTMADHTERICADDFADLMDTGNEFGGSPEAAEAQTNAVRGFFENGISVVTTEVDGKHYVAPVRTVNDLLLTAAQGLDADDIEQLFELDG